MMGRFYHFLMNLGALGTIAEAAPYRGVLAVLGPLGREVALGLEVASRIRAHPG